MLRLGSTEEIEKQFNEGYIRFSCPANWINYARHNAPGIADKFEAVFAHVKRDDPRLATKGDDGVPLNKYRSLWNDEGPDDTLYVRYVFSTLVPAVCFYSIDIKDAARHFGINGNSGYWLKTDLQPYYEAMNIVPDKSSVLIIRYPGQFFEELRREIPKAIIGAQNIDKRDFQVNNPLAVKYVNYDLDIDKLFWDLAPYKELFRKQPRFKDQREARIIIPNAPFTRDPVYLPELYHDNEINIPVPNIKTYASICPVSKCKSIQFENFNEDLSRYDLLFGDKE